MSTPETNGETPVVLVESLPTVVGASAEQIRVTTTVEIVRQGLSIEANPVHSLPPVSMGTRESIDRQPEEPVQPVTSEAVESGAPRKKAVAKKDAATAKKTSAPRNKTAPKENAAPKKAATPRKKAGEKKVAETAAETTEKVAEVVPGFQTQTINVSAGSDLPPSIVPVPVSPEDVEAMRSNEEILVSSQPLSSLVTPSSEPAMTSTSPENHAPETPAPTNVVPVEQAPTVTVEPAPSSPTSAQQPSSIEPAASTSVLPTPIERLPREEWRTIENSKYFSHRLKEQAHELAAFDESQLINNMAVLNDHDHAAMQKVLTEFHWCQHLIAELDDKRNEESYLNFMTGLTALFHAVGQYTGATTEASTLQPGTAAAANTDTGIEKSAIGARIKFLIAELKEMTTPENFSLDFMRTTMAQGSAHRLFGMERQQEVIGYLKQAENIYGPNGLKYRTGAKQAAINVGRTIASPVSSIHAHIANTRTKALRLIAAGLLITAEISALAYAGYKTAGAGISYLRGGSAAAPQDPGAPTDPTPNPLPSPGPNTAPVSPEEQDQAAIEKIFQEMKLEVKGDNLHITFADLGTYQVNNTLFVMMGEGGHLPTKVANPIGAGEFTIQLSPSEKLKGTDLLVSIQGKSTVGTRNFLVPQDSGKNAFKTIEVQ